MCGQTKKKQTQTNDFLRNFSYTICVYRFRLVEMFEAKTFIFTLCSVPFAMANVVNQTAKNKTTREILAHIVYECILQSKRREKQKNHNKHHPSNTKKLFTEESLRKTCRWKIEMVKMKIVYGFACLFHYFNAILHINIDRNEHTRSPHNSANAFHLVTDLAHSSSRIVSHILPQCKSKYCANRIYTAAATAYEFDLAKCYDVIVFFFRFSPFVNVHSTNSITSAYAIWACMLSAIAFASTTQIRCDKQLPCRIIDHEMPRVSRDVLLCSSPLCPQRSIKPWPIRKKQHFGLLCSHVCCLQP